MQFFLPVVIDGMFYLMPKAIGPYRKTAFFTRFYVRTHCFCFIFIIHNGKGATLSLVRKQGVGGGDTDELKNVKCPILALNGSKDTQVQPKINQDGISKALSNGNNKDYLVKELPNLNHMFQECETGNMNEYSKIEQTIAPHVLKEISDWISARTITSKVF